MSAARREFIWQFGLIPGPLLATGCTTLGRAIPYIPAPLPVDLHPVPVGLEAAAGAAGAAQLPIQVLLGE
jgi:hypothetical protein